MKYSEVAEMIESIGLPNAYWQFSQNSGQQPPFICFYFDSDSDFKADDTNYQKIRNLTVELYTNNKDFELEEKVENILTANGLVFSRSESAIESERMYMVTYYTSIVLKGEEDV